MKKKSTFCDTFTLRGEVPGKNMRVAILSLYRVFLSPRSKGIQSRQIFVFSHGASWSENMTWHKSATIDNIYH
jgi:hypothetical protein